MKRCHRPLWEDTRKRSLSGERFRVASFSHLLLTTYYFQLTILMFHLLERYTVESVTSGHPDKVCDQISDAILDAMIEQDPFTRSGVETFGSHGTLMIGGEVKTKAKVDF